MSEHHVPDAAMTVIMRFILVLDHQTNHFVVLLTPLPLLLKETPPTNGCGLENDDGTKRPDVGAGVPIQARSRRPHKVWAP